MTRKEAPEVPLEQRPNGNGTDHQAISRLADELLPLLISRLGASGLGELEVRQDGWRVRLRRGANAANGASKRPTVGAERRPDGASEGEHVQRRRERGRLAITSPGVGYYQPRDGLAVGMTVRGGDLLGHVEVLGVRQDVVAPEGGIVAALAAQPGEAVEYGQPLARLEPELGS
jgi:biotin carboxyl carrier protein